MAADKGLSPSLGVGLWANTYPLYKPACYEILRGTSDFDFLKTCV